MFGMGVLSRDSGSSARAGPERFLPPADSINGIIGHRDESSGRKISIIAALRLL